MNKLLLIGLLGLSLIAQAQERRIPTVAPVTGVPAVTQPNAPELPRFDLDFRGGDVKEFVELLNQEVPGGVNVIIPDDATTVKIPPMKMKGVNVWQVFDALQRASRKLVPVRYGNQVSERVTAYTFTTGNGPITESSVWSFVVDGAVREPEQPGYRFYQLGPYLGQDGLKIEDITTAIQTALKLLNQEPGPTLKFHPETKLLIVVGKDTEFRLIDDVLKELPKAPSKVARLNEALVTGNVNKPGNILLSGPQRLTIVDAIGRAGGLSISPRASGQIKFTRPGQNELILAFDDLKRENDPSKIIHLEPGDVIEVR